MKIANDWGKTWLLKEISPNNELHTKTEINYRQADRRLDAVISKEERNLKKKFIGVKKAINITHVDFFSNDEMTMLNKGFKYNLHTKPKDFK